MLTLERLNSENFEVITSKQMQGICGGGTRTKEKEEKITVPDGGGFDFEKKKSIDSDKIE